MKKVFLLMTPQLVVSIRRRAQIRHRRTWVRSCTFGGKRAQTANQLLIPQCFIYKFYCVTSNTIPAPSPNELPAVP